MSHGENKRQPDYDVSALSRATEYRGKIGAAWTNEDGSISIVLNAFIVLDASQNLLVTLFPRGTRKAKEREL